MNTTDKHCPGCDGKLINRSVRTGAGTFTIDFCPSCYGLWFDPYEINRITLADAKRILRESQKEKRKKPNADFHCPNEHTPLSNYPHESVPDTANLYRCPLCHGVWIYPDSLVTYKNHQEKTIREYKISNVPLPALSALFIPALTLSVVFVLTFITYQRYLTGSNQSVTLQQTSVSRDLSPQPTIKIFGVTERVVTPDVVEIRFETNVPVVSQIAFGNSADSLISVPVSVEPSTIHTQTLSLLKPNVEYFYRMRVKDLSGKWNISTLRLFTTQ